MAVIWDAHLDEEAQRWRTIASDLTAKHFGPAAEAIDKEQRYPIEHLPHLTESGIAGMLVPKHYGGGGASLTSFVAVVEALAEGCASTSAIVAAISLGAIPLLLGANEEQKQELLGNLAREGHAVNFALSERGAGSDPAAIETVAVREKDGWRIKGEKCWLGNGGHSTTFIVFARTVDKDAKNGISAFLVPRNTPGTVIDFYEDKMGIRGTTTTNLKLDVWVPHTNMVGKEGDGLKLALKTLGIGRVVVAAQSNGIALCSFHAASEYAVQRHTFGRPIIDHQGVGFMLANAATQLSAARMMTFEAARAYDLGGDIGLLGTMAKLFASEASHTIVDDALQIFAGRGYVKPNIVERCYRDQRIVEIYEGTSEIQRVVLARAIKKDQLSRLDVKA